MEFRTNRETTQRTFLMNRNNQYFTDITFTKLGGDDNVQKLILQANIPFLVLKQLARFSYMDEDVSNNYYQRRTDEKRIPEIKNFIKESILKQKYNNGIAVIFPTAMLVAAHTDKDITDNQKLYSWDNVFDKQIPEFMIVDGQHRLKGMIEVYDDIQFRIHEFQTEDEKYIINYLDKYRFNCTVMINFDMWEQAQIFADVNFTQKKVSKDLYYSIYGMNPPSEPIDYKKNCIYIAHNLVKLLNTNEESPFKGCIRMLGTGNGVISQSAMADSFIEQMRTPSGVWYVDPYGPPQKHKHMAVEAISFFSEVKETFFDLWIKDSKHVSILCKTTGFAALVKLMRYIHIFKLDNNVTQALNESPSFMNQEYRKKIRDILNPLKPWGNELFGFDGEFAGTGGKGLVNKLFDRMVGLLH